MRRFLAALSVSAVLAAACGLGDGDQATTAPIPATTEAITTTTGVTETTTQSTTTTTAAPHPIMGGSVVIADDQWPLTLNPYLPGGDNIIVTIVGQTHLAGAYDIDASTRELIPELVVDLPTMCNGGVDGVRH